MSVIHFLNVKQGDCSWIKHNDGKITVIDVCNAYKEKGEENFLTTPLRGLGFGIPPRPQALGLLSLLGKSENPTSFGLSSRYAIPQYSTHLGLSDHYRTSNFNRKAYPENPINYLKRHGVHNVFRFILTHPDMDHMDGIKDFFIEFEPTNFWDIANNKEMDSFEGSPYSEGDWNFYKKLRNGKVEGISRLTLYDGASGKYYNRDEQGNDGGNGLYVLAPSKELIQCANETNDYNDCSYVILYKTGDKKILFGGDSNNTTWEYILKNHKSKVTDIDLLIAPHHGRDSMRSYDFLDILKPKLTFFGNAKSEHLAYEQWNRKGLEKITNNQGNCLIARTENTSMDIFVTHQEFAKEYTGNNTYFDHEVSGWHIKTL